MRVGIYGGSFNPIHNGHVAVINLVKHLFDEVWVMPCYDHFHGKNLVDSYARLKMCHLATENIPNVFVSDFEIYHQIQGGTLVCLEKIKELLGENDYCFIIGQDNAETIETWNNYKDLLEKTSFCVVQRESGLFCGDQWYNKEPNMFVENKQTLGISSTKVREMIKNNVKIDIINKKVAEYIKDNSLYLQ